MNDTPAVILEIVPPARVDRPLEPEAGSALPNSLGQPRLIPVLEFPFQIGRRDESNHLLLMDVAISRRSVEITQTEDQFELHDLGQRSGVLVNGRKVEGRKVLQFDDVITFPSADVKITFRQPRKQPSPPEAPEPSID